MSTLDTWLGHYYRASVGGNSMETVIDGFRHAVEANQELREEAVARRASFNEGILKRCHISRVYRDALDAVLN